MAPKFGTSGLRGLVVELTPDLVADHVRAFVAACDIGSGLCIGQDLRPSSPRIAGDIIAAARAEGVRVIDCGALPTPALALAARDHGAGAVMVTGSHIPADRNGLKFYSHRGEITKTDETAINAALGRPAGTAAGTLETDGGAAARFVERYVSACGPGALAGRRIGLYSHSAVGRDDLAAMLRAIGAEVVELGRSETFIPVDTEAVDPDTRAQIAEWVAAEGLDALVSTDGDSDRPLLADETGTIVPGDVMGQITAERLGAEHVVTPISSNSGVTRKGFARVETTRIGSPYVIAGMEELGGKVVGYEANGGFLLGFEAQGPAGPLAPLPTRDCMLPLIVTLIAARDGRVSERIAQEPPVVTMADRLQEVPQEASQPFVARLAQDTAARGAFLSGLGAEEAGCDLTDGVRMSLADGRTVHIRPSGNAPELRLYVEAIDRAGAEALMDRGLTLLREAVLGV
ncbi:phosphomannomutase [Salipiger abyssi]|uniref:phosphomannomutase n=1 Tax=Salipiger abyssi TaxID=1250539 RepID=UPI001A906D9F|nr:phosphomannomutase [Salipiger abyssi]MBN9889839.1 phosphomannomutase [Salipiger abyssi]